MTTPRYYLAPTGQKVVAEIGEDHADIGRRVLAAVGITPKDYSDIYDQMELIGYFRVVEFQNRVFAENSVRRPNRSQMRFLQDRQFNSGTERELLINDTLFTETRRCGSLTHKLLNEIREELKTSCA